MQRKDLPLTPAHSERAVEVLIPDNASGAWTWLSAELVIRARDKVHADYRVVIIHRGTPQEYADAVLVKRIRWKAPTDERKKIGNKYRKSVVDVPKKCVEKGTFVKRAMRLPEGFPATVIAATLKHRNRVMNYRLQNAAHAVCVGHVDGCLVYIQVIQRQSASGTKELTKLQSFHSALLKFMSRMRLIICGLYTELFVPMSALHEAAVLPAELWREVFLCLDTVTQSRLRPVCALWHAVLDSTYFKANVVLDSAAFSKTDLSGCLSPVCLMTAAIFKRLSPSTKHIVVADRRQRMGEMDLEEVFDILHFSAQRNASIKLKGIHLFGLEYCLLNRSSYDYPESENDYPDSESDYSEFECGLHPYLQQRANTIVANSNTRAYQKSFCDSIRLIKCTITLDRCA
ncbi:uncharacterized protein LOC129598272 [Paramacrobiotus metropolitanus]|uniref:uncharacterized protein LOC129598272 n=1 Tax=Paramacrobiotus metropolitanus TaxID=2943436 RepID=UPI002446465F|nr:uncharacterized protein LOC129598272 [Paramacrobiotus metropolitanus]